MNDYNRRARVPDRDIDTAEEGVIARSIRYYATEFGAGAMWLLARVLPCSLASWLGGAALAVAGPQLRKHRQVLFNLHRALPEAEPAVLRRTARDVWRNLGSVLFEYPHLARIAAARVTVEMPAAVRDRLARGEPMLFMTGHLANWEVIASYLGTRAPGLVVVYSPNDNPGIARMIQRFRRPGGCEYVTKQEALRKLTPKFLAGRSVGLLPDVRVDSAPSLPLFGIPAPTTVSPPRIAARLGYPMVPVRARRVGPARFVLEFHEALPVDPEADPKRAALDAMTRFNQVLEGWISERPGEWMCAKRRWPRTPEGH